MIDKEELLSNKEFYKSFKSGEDLSLSSNNCIKVP